MVLLEVEKGSEARGGCGIKIDYRIPLPMNEVCDLNEKKKIIVYMSALFFLIQREDS